MKTIVMWLDTKTIRSTANEQLFRPATGLHLWLYLWRRLPLRQWPLRLRMRVTQAQTGPSAGTPGPVPAGHLSYGIMRPTRSGTSEAIEPDPDTPDVIRVLLDNHARFLAFLERRVGSRDVAEDILQEAFVRGLGQGGSIRNAESAIAWFYRVLRNAVTDHFRRQDSQDRALERLAAETEPDEGPLDRDLEALVCQCVLSLIDTLKPEYATALRRVELDGMSVRGYAEEAGITGGNAGVRVHRAREALRKQLVRSCGTCLTHGCFDCQCKTQPAQNSSQP
jgi:RNA polymerase sigma factor (sigma-70 family)